VWLLRVEIRGDSTLSGGGWGKGNGTTNKLAARESGASRRAATKAEGKIKFSRFAVAANRPLQVLGRGAWPASGR
jgi:hypothetical protein